MDDGLRQKGAEYRARTGALLDSLCEVINEAKKEGYVIAFSIGDNAVGQQVVTRFDVLLHL